MNTIIRTFVVTLVLTGITASVFATPHTTGTFSAPTAPPPNCPGDDCDNLPAPQ